MKGLDHIRKQKKNKSISLFFHFSIYFSPSLNFIKIRHTKPLLAKAKLSPSHCHLPIHDSIYSD